MVKKYKLKQNAGKIGKYDKSGYTGNSIVDFLSSQGMDSSKSSRVALAKKYGMDNYDFSAGANNKLLGMIRNSSPVTTPTPYYLQAGEQSGFTRGSTLPSVDPPTQYGKSSKVEFNPAQNNISDNTRATVSQAPMGVSTKSKPKDTSIQYSPSDIFKKQVQVNQGYGSFGSNYIMIDDKNSNGYLMSPDHKILKQFPVVTGKNSGESSKVSSREWIEQNPGKSFKDYVDYLGSNNLKYTPSGIYYISGKNPDPSEPVGLKAKAKQLLYNTGINTNPEYNIRGIRQESYGDKMLTIENLKGEGMGEALHGTGHEDRLKNLYDSTDASQRKMSSGCVNLGDENIQFCYDNVDKGAPVYMLREDGKTLNPNEMKFAHAPANERKAASFLYDNYDKLKKDFGDKTDDYIRYSMGIMDQESKFGKSLKFMGEGALDAIAPDLVTSDGYSQVKYDILNPKTKKTLSEYGINSGEDLYTPESSAMAAMYKLKEIPAKNIKDKLLAYTGATKHPEERAQYINNVQNFGLSKKQYGGDDKLGPIGFMNSYYTSGEFNRKQASIGDPSLTPKIITRRLSNYRPYIDAQGFGSETALDMSRAYEIKNERNLDFPGKLPNVYLDPSQAKEMGTDLFNDVLPHEYAHWMKRDLSDKEADMFSSAFQGEKPNIIERALPYLVGSAGKVHDATPEENYSDLSSLRYMMYKEGIYDARKGDMTPENLKKAMENKSILKQFDVQRLLKSFKPEDIIKLNNHVASNDAQQPMNQAANGSSIKRYGDGGELPNFNEFFQHGGYAQNGSDEEDSYDFGNSILQNYYQRQQDSQQQQQQQEQEQAASYEEPPQQESSDESASSGEPQQDMSIPDADYFAKAAFQYNGDNARQEELDDLREQMAMMQSNQSALEGMLLGDFDQGGEDNSDGEDGGGYRYGTPDYHYTSPDGSGGGTAAVRYNNPGNIKYGDFAASFGATKGEPATDGGNFAYFPNTGAGLRAQKALLRSKGYADLNVTDAMKRWSNNGPYSEKIGQTFGNKLMKDMSDAEMDALIKMQIQGEDTNMYKKLYHQSGGSVPVASSSAQKYHGLNNDDLQHLLIENNGYNFYRGLDSGKPVHLYDERGAYQTLFGPEDLATLYGNVYEHR